MEPKTKSKKKTEQNDIATSNTTTNPDPPPVVVPDSSAPLPSGANASGAVLSQQAADSIQLGIELKTGLSPAGWPPEKNVDLEARRDAYDEASVNVSTQREANKKSRLVFQALVASMIVFRNQMVAALMAATQGSANPFRDARLHLEGTQVPRRMGEWFKEVIVQVEMHKDALAGRFPSDPVELTKSNAAKLMTALGVQDNNRQQLPALTKKKREAKLKLAAAIAEQRLAAKVAFQTDKLTLQRFVPLWQKQRRAGKVAKTQGGGETTAQPGTAGEAGAAGSSGTAGAQAGAGAAAPGPAAEADKAKAEAREAGKAGN